MDSPPRTKSKALEVNLADTRVDVAIDPSYAVVLEVMSEYYGLTEGVDDLPARAVPPVSQLALHRRGGPQVRAGVHPPLPEARPGSGGGAGHDRHPSVGPERRARGRHAVGRGRHPAAGPARPGRVGRRRRRPALPAGRPRRVRAPGPGGRGGLRVRRPQLLLRVGSGAGGARGARRPRGRRCASTGWSPASWSAPTPSGRREPDPQPRFDREAAEFGPSRRVGRPLRRTSPTPASPSDASSWRRILAGRPPRRRGDGRAAAGAARVSRGRRGLQGHPAEIVRARQHPRPGASPQTGLPLPDDERSRPRAAARGHAAGDQPDADLDHRQRSLPRRAAPHPQDLLHPQRARAGLPRNRPELRPQHGAGRPAHGRPRPRQLFYRRPDRLRFPVAHGPGGGRRVAHPGQQRPPAERAHLAGADQAQPEALDPPAVGARHPPGRGRRPHPGQRPVPAGRHGAAQQPRRARVSPRQAARAPVPGVLQRHRGGGAPAGGLHPDRRPLPPRGHPHPLPAQAEPRREQLPDPPLHGGRVPVLAGPREGGAGAVRAALDLPPDRFARSRT